jgi:hypothetical protein
MSTAGQCAEWASVLRLGSALPDIVAFINAFQGVGGEAKYVGSNVAETGAPFELSISSNDPGAFRLLGEAHVYGESMIGTLHRNLAAFHSIDPLHQLSEPACIRRLLDVLNPPGELLSTLKWRFAFYTAVRTDGARRSLRCYFNLLWGSREHRFLRVNQALDVLHCQDYRTCVNRLAALFVGWGGPVGLSCDIANGSLVPAKLHFSIERPSPYRMALLENWAGVTVRKNLIERFLNFRSHQDDSRIPYLLSVGLDTERPKSLKLDLVLRGLSGLERDKILAQTLQAVDANWMRDILPVLDKRVFSDQRPPAKQYLGLNCERDKAPYVNVYYSVGRPEYSTATSYGDAAQRGLALVEMMQSASGGFPFESCDFGHRQRQIPEHGCDIYMTALTHQCLQSYFPNTLPDVLHRCVQFITTRREDEGWRYLPELPLDVDDSAMAIVSLFLAGVDVPNELLASLAAQQSASGGFRTFFHCDNDGEHFAVTANAVYALWDRDRKNAVRGLNYLLRWLEAPRWGELQWMYSPLLSMYLLVRDSARFAPDSSAIQSKVAEIVLDLRRKDGLWGNGNPECVETALAALALGHCGVAPDSTPTITDHLIHSQRPDGSWPWAPMFSDGDGQWFGQRALSTVLCAAALRLSGNQR